MAHILMTTDAVSAAWPMTVSLATALGRFQHRVSLAVLGPRPTDAQLAEVAGVQGVDVELTDLELEWRDPQGADMTRASEALLLMERRLSPDLIHLTSYREAAFAWNAPVVIMAHACVLSWLEACCGIDEEESAVWETYRANATNGLNTAQAWTSPSASFADSIRRLYAPSVQGEVVRLGIETFPASLPKEPFILAEGRFWDQAKNVASLAEIASRIDWPIRLAGAFDERADRTVSLPATDEHLALLGPLPHSELLSLMDRAGIFASPALYDPAGLSVLEAAAAGCALALSDIPSFREQWDGAALFIDAGNEEQFSATLNHLCRDAKLRDSLQRAARDRAATYSLAATAAGYMQLYRRIAGAQPRPVPGASSGPALAFVQS